MRRNRPPPFSRRVKLHTKPSPAESSRGDSSFCESREASQVSTSSSSRDIARMAPECKVCRANYSQGAKAPVALSCGHSTCRECLQHIYNDARQLKCPTCRMVHTGAALKDLKDNFDLLGEATAEQPRPQRGNQEGNQTTIRIIVKDLTDKQFFINVDPKDTFLRVKETLHAQYGLTPENIRLLYRGQRLQDDKTPNFYNIVEGTTIQMSTTYKGGKGREDLSVPAEVEA
ncbi:hypothetical protein C7M84_008865 [Penaeus vannamei]|uniref:RING-type domain-containing protein n=1 Tax=Penaeus vannamei TaxID=6689 RepID=A0A3R7M4L1_PENVA|nr:hypothetical protein C7M84_008865 [Penaeus vannamei]